MKPAAECGGVWHTIGVFQSGSGIFPAAVFDKIAPQRLTASNQAVMCVRQREHGQEGDRDPAATALAASNCNPVMVFVVSLFSSQTMAHDRILQANWAKTNDSIGVMIGPIGWRLALLRRK